MSLSSLTWSVVVVVIGVLAAGRLVAEEDAPPAPAPDAADVAPAQELADLAFLVGRWRSVQGAAVWEESWSPAEGDAMVAVTRWVQAGRTRLYEVSAIEARAEGIVLSLRHFGPGLVPWASEKDGALTWQLTCVEGTSATFASPDRPFPRRVVYTLREDGHLEARLEGVQNDEEVSMAFDFSPVR